MYACWFFSLIVASHFVTFLLIQTVSNLLEKVVQCSCCCLRSVVNLLFESVVPFVIILKTLLLCDHQVTWTPIYTHTLNYSKRRHNYPYRPAQNQANSFNFDLDFVKQQQKRHMTHTDNLRIVWFCFSDEFSRNIKMIHHHLDGKSVRVFHAYHFTVSRFKLHLKWTLHSVQLTRSWKIYIHLRMAAYLPYERLQCLVLSSTDCWYTQPEKFKWIPRQVHRTSHRILKKWQKRVNERERE